MNKTNLLSFLFGCVLLVILVGITGGFILAIQEADANVKAGIIGILGVLLTAILTNFFTRRREINARHFSEKREAYGKIINIVFDAMASTKSGKKLPDKALVNKMMEFKKGLMIWGDPEVIESWNKFEMESGEGQSRNDSRIIFVAMEHVLRAIRKDLGHDDRRLKFGDLCRLIIVAEDKEKVFYK